MTPALAERAPDPTDDPRILALVLDEYAHADRLRATLLAGFFFAAAGIFALLWGAGVAGVAPIDPAVRRGLPVGIAGGMVLGTIELLLRRQAARPRTGPGRALAWYGSTVVEVGVIAAGWVTVSTVGSMSGLLFPRTIGYAALTILSALRLDWRITVFTGVLSAAAAASLHLVLQPPVHGEPALRPGVVSAVSSLVIIGILAALVAEQARRRTLHAIGAIVERQRLERELMGAVETERERIGRDLHDGLGGRLSGLVLLAQGLARRAEGGEPVTSDHLRELAALAGDGVDEVRRIARGLDPAPMEHGLAPALRALAERVERAGPASTFALEGEDVPTDRETTLHLYHIAQEAVTNATRHGKADRIDIRLTVRAGTIALDVRDDGSGLPDAHVEGLGLRTMRTRAALLDAVLRVRRGAKGGTVVSCVVRRARTPTGGNPGLVSGPPTKPPAAEGRTHP